MERDSRYINAPVWPWLLAGWLLAAMIFLIYGAGGVIVPFVGIKAIDVVLVALGLA